MQNSMRAPSRLKVSDRLRSGWKDEWSKDARLNTEFDTAEDYVAFKSAVQRGCVSDDLSRDTVIKVQGRLVL